MARAYLSRKDGNPAATSTASRDSIACSFSASPLLREYVRGYLYRDHYVTSEAVVRPVSAETDPRLVFALGDRTEAYDYVTGATRVLSEAMIVGPQTRRLVDLRITGRHHVFIVCFQPAGLNRLFGLPAGELVDRAEDAAQLLGPDITTISQSLRDLYAYAADSNALLRCIERFLKSRLGAATRVQPIHRAAFELQRSHGVTELCRLVQESGHGVRQFNRAFLQQIGMSPKRYARVARFGYAMRLKLERPLLTWADVSQQAGYYDQNHMVKDFRSLAGEVPSTYLKVMAGTPASLRESATMMMSNSY